MLETLEQITTYQMFALFVIVVVFIGIEWIILTRQKKLQEHESGLVSSLSGLYSFIGVMGINKLFWYGIMFVIYEYRIFDLGLGWEAWLIGVFAFDLMFYLSHVLGHHVRLFWCMHAVHHTSEEMRLTSSIRGSIFDFLYLPAFFAILPIFGIHPFIVLIVETISKAYGIYTHIHESFIGKQPLLEYVFITPSAHRVHHGKNDKYLDRNYAQMFSIWDRLFGTWQTEEEKPVYGVLAEIESDKMKPVQFHAIQELLEDVKLASSITEKLKFIFYHPSWKYRRSVVVSDSSRFKNGTENREPI